MGPARRPAHRPGLAESRGPVHLNLALLREIVRDPGPGGGTAAAPGWSTSVLAVGEADRDTVRHAGGVGTLRIWQTETEIVAKSATMAR